MNTLPVNLTKWEVTKNKMLLGDLSQKKSIASILEQEQEQMQEVKVTRPSVKHVEENMSRVLTVLGKSARSASTMANLYTLREPQFAKMPRRKIRKSRKIWLPIKRRRKADQEEYTNLPKTKTPKIQMDH